MYSTTQHCGTRPALHKLAQMPATRQHQLKCSGMPRVALQCCTASYGSACSSDPAPCQNASERPQHRSMAQTLLHIPITSHHLCVSTESCCPRAQVQKTLTPHYLQGPVDQVSNNEQHHPVLQRRHRRSYKSRKKFQKRPLPQKFRIASCEDLESGSCKHTCTWL